MQTDHDGFSYPRRFYDPRKEKKLHEAERKVIESAKAWRERMLKYAVCEQEYTLMAAVEELLAAEKGE